MQIRLLNTDLIRRYGCRVLNADPSFAKILINKGFAINLKTEKDYFEELKKKNDFYEKQENKIIQNRNLNGRITIFPEHFFY